jgi:hypothetical protein
VPTHKYDNYRKPTVDFWVPKVITNIDGIMDNLGSFENLLAFERDDDL